MKAALLLSVVLGVLATSANASVERSYSVGDPAATDDSDANGPIIFDVMVQPGSLVPSNGRVFPDRRTENLRLEVSELSLALRSDEPDPEIFYKRGMVYARLRDHDRAIADFEEATKLNPDHHQAYNEQGRSYAAKGQLDRALTSFDKAIAIQPDYGVAYDYRGRIYARKRQNAKAIANYDAAIRINPDDTRSLNDSCWTRAVIRIELKKALEHCDRAVSLRPLNGNYLDSRAFVHFRLGQFAQAIADYDAALTRHPNSRGALLYMRGVAKLRLGDRTGGNIDVAGSKTLNPRAAAQFASYGIRP
jgi:tetratricopeptide (TPR) repeat protein